MSSNGKFTQFAVWNIHTAVFPPVFVSEGLLFVVLQLVLKLIAVDVDVAVNGNCNQYFLYFFIFSKSLDWCIYANLNVGESSPCFPRHIESLCRPSSVQICALSSISLFSGPSVWVHLLSSLRSIQSILQRRLNKYSFLNCCIYANFDVAESSSPFPRHIESLWCPSGVKTSALSSFSLFSGLSVWVFHCPV